MKRLLSAAVILGIVLLCGCQYSDSIGIIGGADGPSEIYVSTKSDLNPVSECEAVRAVRINGGLYYDTGEESDLSARCGTFDGRFIKGGENAFVIPEYDGYSNFGDGGYQIGSRENTIEIPMGEEWKIFRKIDDNADILKYKYIMKIEGITPCSIEEKEFTILSNEMDITAGEVEEFLKEKNTKNLDIYIIEAE